MFSLISPLGFDSTHILALINKYGIKEGDQIFLIQAGNKDNRAKNAFEEVSSFIHRVSEEIKVYQIILDHKNFQSMVLDIMDIINDSSYLGIHETPIIVNLSGGPREILVALTAAAQLRSKRIAHFVQFSDIDRDLTEILLPSAKKQDDDSNKIIKLIHEKSSISIGEIACQLQFSESKVSRICARLSAEDYVELNKIGKYKYAKITFNGQLSLKI